MSESLQLESVESLAMNIGEGSFGKVYKVEHPNGRCYAIKKIQLKAFHNEREEVEKESEVMRKCEHNNLVKIYESRYDEADDKIEIIMEYCEEGDLMKYAKRRGRDLTLVDKLNIFRQIVMAFVYLNVKGIIHRDLKPENILLTKGMTVKIADFGCARLVSFNQMSKLESFSVDKGTLIFASPEQLMNEKYSSKCDVWAAGCLLYVLIFGRHPFLDNSYSSTLACIRDLTLKQPFKIPTDCNLTVARILSLTLIYADKERASWRELWLSRFFAEKLQNVQDYVLHLKYITIIANWLSKEFWKVRKEFEVDEAKAHTFVYFLIKFQSSCLSMATGLLNKSPQFRYLFAEHVYEGFHRSESQLTQIVTLAANIQSYFSMVKTQIQKTEHKAVIERDLMRVSCFSDLDSAIRACYKILLDIRERVEAQGLAKGRVWLIMARWLNFEKWFSFEKGPRVERIITENIERVKEQVNTEIQKYEKGEVE